MSSYEEDLDRALQADLDGVELQSDDEDDTVGTTVALTALELQPFVPLDQLKAAAAAYDNRGGGSSSLLDELQAVLESIGTRACEGYAADVSEAATLMASMALPAATEPVPPPPPPFPPQEKPKKPDFRKVDQTGRAALQAAYEAALAEYNLAMNARAVKTKAVILERSVTGTPPASYVCQVCSKPGHFVVNCPTVRQGGRQDLYGRQRYRIYKRQLAKGKPMAAFDPLNCGEAVVEERAVATGPWSMNELDAYPMRETCLQQNVLIADLSEALQARLWLYVETKVMPRNHRDRPEIASGEPSAALAACVRDAPTALRVKELCESIEAFAVLVGFLGTACTQQGRTCSTIAELACGHGLVGILLAYRFPQREVLCVDLAQRPAFESIVAAFRAVMSARCDAPLTNLRFVESSLDCESVRARLGDQAFCVALHACTEANGAAIDMATEVGAMWAVMPCCMRTAACFPEGCQMLRCPDATRHALLCGALVERHQAELVVSIDKRITNRHVIICGGIAAHAERAAELQWRRATRETPQPPARLRFHIT